MFNPNARAIRRTISIDDARFIVVLKQQPNSDDYAISVWKVIGDKHEGESLEYVTDDYHHHPAVINVVSHFFKNLYLNEGLKPILVRPI